MMFMFDPRRIFSRAERTRKTPINLLISEEISTQVQQIIVLLAEDVYPKQRYHILVDEIRQDLDSIEMFCASSSRWLISPEAEQQPMLLGAVAVGLFRKGELLGLSVGKYVKLLRTTGPRLNCFGSTQTSPIPQQRADATSQIRPPQGVVIGSDTQYIARTRINVGQLSRRQRRKLARELAQIAGFVATAISFIRDQLAAQDVVPTSTLETVLKEMEYISGEIANRGLRLTTQFGIRK